MDDALISALEQDMKDFLLNPQNISAEPVPSVKVSKSQVVATNTAPQKNSSAISSFPVPYKKGPVDYNSIEPPPLEPAIHPIGPRPAHHDHPVYRARQAVPAMERLIEVAREELNISKERKRDRKITCGRCGKKVEKGTKTKLFKCSQCK
jgi:hypothetical protein